MALTQLFPKPTIQNPVFIIAGANESVDVNEGGYLGMRFIPSTSLLTFDFARFFINKAFSSIRNAVITFFMREELVSNLVIADRSLEGFHFF